MSDIKTPIQLCQQVVSDFYGMEGANDDYVAWLQKEIEKIVERSKGEKRPLGEDVLQSRTIKDRLETHLILEDSSSWIDGVYYGDREAKDKEVNTLCGIINEWVSDGMPK